MSSAGALYEPATVLHQALSSGFCGRKSPQVECVGYVECDGYPYECAGYPCDARVWAMFEVRTYEGMAAGDAPLLMLHKFWYKP